MPLTITRTVDATVEPVTKDEVRQHLRLDTVKEEDDQLDALITTARQLVEQWLEKALITQTWVRRLDRFPGYWDAIELPNPPLIAVSSIAYTDQAGVAQTLSASLYQIDAYSVPPRIAPIATQAWPTVQIDTYNAVTITYTAGYGAAATAVPRPIRQAILLLIGELWENREATLVGTINTTLPFGVAALLGPYRTMTVR